MVRKFTRLGSIIVILLCTGNVVFGQVSSVQDGDWNDPATWDCGCIPDYNELTITVGHDVVITADITIDETTVIAGGSLLINAGVIVTLNEDFSAPPFTVDEGVTLTVIGTLDGSGLVISPVNIYGHVINTGTISIPDVSVMYFGSESSYTHSHVSGGDIPLATWDADSDILINGMSQANPSPPNNLNQSFGNFTWNCSNQGANTTTFNFGGQLNDVQGSLTFQSSNNRPIRFNVGGPGYSLTIGRDFINNGTPIILAESTTAGTTTVTVEGNFLQTGGSLAFRVTNDFNVILEVKGNFSKTVGAFAGGNGTGSSTLRFNGGVTKAPQSYTMAGTAIATINYEIVSNSVVHAGTSIFTGTGSFILATGSSLGVGSVHGSGALQNTATLDADCGNLITTFATRNFQEGSTIIYNGSSTQYIGNGFPSSGGNVNLTIANNSVGGVVLSDNLDIVALRTLFLSSGNLVIGNQTLTINGTITGSGGIVGGPTSNLVIGGTGSFGTLNFAGTNQLLNFTVNRTSSGLVTMGGDLTVLGTFTQTAGDISLNGNDLTISGIFARTAGNFIINSASSLVINGSGTMAAVGLSGTALNTLTLDRSGATFSSGAAITVTNLNLLDGTFTNSAGFAIANGGTITRDAGTMAVEPASSGTYNLLYSMSGTITSGVEFSSVTTRIQNVTINGGGTVNLANDRTINGDLTLTSGNFNIGTTTVTLKGNLIANSSGTFTLGTFLFDGNTTISGSAIPTFGDIQVGDTRTLTLPSTDVNVAGNILFDAGAIINPGSGTLTLTGDMNPQTISGGGATLGDVTVNKTNGADVDLTSQLNITGSLRVASANSDFAANGNLVLKSTSDGITDNGRIGALLNGATVSGNVVVERFMAAEGRIYRYISSPVTGFTVADLQLIFPVTGSFTGTSVCGTCLTNQSMFSYDGSTQAYVDFPATTNSEVLLPGIGYSAFVRQDVIGGPATIDWTGPINQGTVSLPVSHNGSPSSSWNLVGNPYPSSIDWDNAGWTKTNISESISVRDNSTGIFQSWNGTTGGLIAGKIATGQGFWVRTTGASPVLQLTEPVKSIINGIFFKKAEDEVLNQFVLTLSDGVVEDNAYYWIGDGASNGLDDFDAVKLDNFRNTGTIPLMDLGTYSYGEDAMPMAINSIGQLNCGDTVRVYTNDLIEGTYTMKFDASGFVQSLTWILRDKFLNTQVNVSQNPEYQFVVNAEADSKAVERFELVVEYTPVEITTSGNTLISSHETGNQWYLNGVLLPGETNQELTAGESGLYTLVTNSGGCSASADLQFVITGEENPLSNQVQVYPNPFTDRIRIEITSAAPVMTRIYNPIGLLMMEKLLDGQGAVKSAEFDFSGSPAGLYILHIQKEGRTHQVKIIKSKE